MVGNPQTYELGLSRIGKSGKGKSMALKAKSNDTDESSDDEESKMKSYIIRQFKKFMKNANGRNFDKDCRQSNSTRSSTPTSIPFDTCICPELLAAYIRPLYDPEIISLRSLS